nr:MAG TPA: hypothetical protein [Caudoviricetes sp.]
MAGGSLTEGGFPLLNSDSNYFKAKYGIEQLMKYAKRRVSIESKIRSRTTSSTLAAA